MWKETTKQRRNFKIFKEEFESFLPARILDFHVHVFPKETISPEHEKFSCAGHEIMQYTLEELKRDLVDTYPRRNCYALCFGMPEKEYNIHSNNEYLAKYSDHRQFFPLRLLRPEDDPQTVAQEIEEKNFLGFKPYPNYVNKEVEDIEINDMLPTRLMKIAQEFSLIIILHIPKKGRLADPANQRQIVQLARNYPKTKIVLAHIGRAYFLKNIVGHLDEIKGFANVYYDLASLNNWEVLEYLFDNVESYKILYGTDMPMALAPGKSVEINNQYTYVTPLPWKLSISDNHKKLIFASFLYEELRAIKKAVKRLNLSKRFTEDIFYNNGMELLASVKMQR